jgi:hypothetical protein
MLRGWDSHERVHLVCPHAVQLGPRPLGLGDGHLAVHVHGLPFGGEGSETTGCSGHGHFGQRCW